MIEVMNQEIPPKTERKQSILHSTTPSRPRAASKAKDSSPKPESFHGVASVSPTLRARAKSATQEASSNGHKIRKSLVLNKPKSVAEDGVGSHKGREIVGRSGNRPVVEQFARPSRRNEENPDGKKRDLQEKLDLSENLVRNLQSEVMGLKAELDKSQGLNVELESQNKKLNDDLVAAQAKIAALTSQEQGESIAKYQTSKFKDIQKLISNKLEHPKVKESISEPIKVKPPSTPPVHQISIAADTQRKVRECSPSPPPPPPLPLRPPARAANTQKAPTLVELYHSLTKREGKKESPRPANQIKPAAISAHNSIVGEFQNRSAHLLKIKNDIETKGEFINGLIQKVLAADYTNIEDVLKFVDWLDSELSSLADERAVLKHFNWPERKADAMREAAIEYRDLKLLESEISSYEDDTSISCGAALKKIASLLDKSERSIQRLIKQRNSFMLSYRGYKIPTDWMLDSGIVSKIKQASMKLAKLYIQRVKIELESVRNSERESVQEALLLQGVHFAYRAHQFAGGLDSETLCAFEEIRRRVPGHLGGSRELLTGIPS